MRSDFYPNKNRTGDHMANPVDKGGASYRTLILLAMITLCFIACKKQPEIDRPDTPQPEPPVTTVPVATPELSKLGYGYDVTGQYLSSASVRFLVLDVKALYASSANRVVIDIINSHYNREYAGRDAFEYAQSLSASSKVTIGKGLFSGSLSIKDSMRLTSDISYAGFFDFIKRKELKFNASPDILQQYLTPEFSHDVKTQSPEYIVKHYGVGVLGDIVLGGRFDAVFSTKTTTSNQKLEAKAGLDFSLKDVFGFNVSGAINQSSYQYNSSQQLSYRTSGGNAAIALLGDIDLGPTVPTKIQLGQWQTSVTLENSELIDLGDADGIIPLPDLISDPVKAAAVKSYIDQYLLLHQVKTIDAPQQVYTYYDYDNGRHAYSIENVPSIHGNYKNSGAAFKAYNKQMPGAIPIYEQYNPAKNIWAYTQSRTALEGFSVSGVAFYAYATKVAGSQELFEFYYEKRSNKRMYYDTWYSFDKSIPDQDTHYTGIAFYAFP